MGNFCFPGHDDDGPDDHEELILRATRNSRISHKDPIEDLHERYREAELKSQKDIESMEKKVDMATENLRKVRIKMAELLNNRDPEELEPEEFIRMQGFMEEESELTISLSSFSSNLMTLRKQFHEMERQYTEATAFQTHETKTADPLDVIKLTNKFAPQRTEYRKQFTKVLSMAHQQRADLAEDEKEDLLEGGAASEQLVDVHKFTPDQLERLKKLRALPPAPTKVPVLKNTIESLSRPSTTTTTPPAKKPVVTMPLVM